MDTQIYKNVMIKGAIDHKRWMIDEMRCGWHLEQDQSSRSWQMRVVRMWAKGFR